MGNTRTALFYTLLQVLPLGLIQYGACAALPADATPHDVVSTSPADEAAVFARDVANESPHQQVSTSPADEAAVFARDVANESPHQQVSTSPADEAAVFARDVSVPEPDVKEWFTVNADGSDIQSVDSPPKVPADSTGSTRPKSGALSFLETSSSSGTNLYTYGFGGENGAVTQRPGLAKLLFDCEFWLTGSVPNYGLGPKQPYPNGVYACGNSASANGTIRIQKVQNNVGWNMTYNDIAFVLKVLHDTKGVLPSSQYFGFQFQYTPNNATTAFAPVLNGQFSAL